MEEGSEHFMCCVLVTVYGIVYVMCILLCRIVAEFISRPFSVQITMLCLLMNDFTILQTTIQFPTNIL